MPVQFSASNTPLDPSQPIVLSTIGDLQSIIHAAVADALAQQEARHKAEQRYTTAQAAAFLGCSTGFLQKLHQRGLPYEKGRPNYYRLADLQVQQASRRLDIQQ